MGQVFKGPELIKAGVCRVEKIYSYNNTLDVELWDSS